MIPTPIVCAFVAGWRTHHCLLSQPPHPFSSRGRDTRAVTDGHEQGRRRTPAGQCCPRRVCRTGAPWLKFARLRFTATHTRTHRERIHPVQQIEKSRYVDGQKYKFAEMQEQYGIALPMRHQVCLHFTPPPPPIRRSCPSMSNIAFTPTPHAVHGAPSEPAEASCTP